MTKRDYEVIAEIIAEMNWDESYTSDTVYEIARIFSIKLQQDNHKFNKITFMSYIKERM